MYRYPDGTYKVCPPARVVYKGYKRKVPDLTREQLDEIGYNEAVPLQRKPFTAYETEWQKGEDLIYREVVISTVVDEVAKNKFQSKEVRAERNARLLACDWTQMQDTPLDADVLVLWRNYRQALRDVPKQAGFPHNVVWPEAPAGGIDSYFQTTE